MVIFDLNLYTWRWFNNNSEFSLSISTNKELIPSVSSFRLIIIESDKILPYELYWRNEIIKSNFTVIFNTLLFKNVEAIESPRAFPSLFISLVIKLCKNFRVSVPLIWRYALFSMAKLNLRIQPNMRPLYISLSNSTLIIK